MIGIAAVEGAKVGDGIGAGLAPAHAAEIESLFDDCFEADSTAPEAICQPRGR